MGSRVIRLDATPSTSDTAKRLARSGEPHGTVVVAAEQTRGRGQRGRRWASPPGGLWASALIRPIGLAAARVGMLSIVAAVAAAEATADASAVRTGLRWPNDLLVSTRKVGGVLVETSAAGGKIEWAVIGVGINANFPAGELAGEYRDLSVSLRDVTGRDISLDELLHALCARLDELLGLLEAGRTEEIRERWRTLDTTAGRWVRRVRAGFRPPALATSKEVAPIGRAQGIDAAGRLIVRSSQGLMVIPTSRGIVIE